MGSILSIELIETNELVKNLKALNSYPKYIEISKCGDLHFVASKTSRPNNNTLMDYDAFIGVDSNKNLAISKSLTEYVERQVCRNNTEFPRANEGANLALKRINNFNSTDKVKLPKLEISRVLSHRFEDAVLLYQSLFLNQPVFIGGDLKRLCI